MFRSPQLPRTTVTIWKKMLGSAAIAALGVAGAAALSGCVAHGELVADYPVVEVETVPVEIAAYPHVIYAGSDAYLVGGRWYYRSRGRWVVFQREPRELAAYRVEYTRRAPPSRGVISAPPAHRRRNER